MIKKIIGHLPVASQVSLASTSRSVNQLVKEVQAPYLEGVGMDACQNFAERGDLHRLQWAVEHGMPFNLLECELAAAKNGHGEVLLWLHATLSPNQPWSDGVLVEVAERGDVQLLKQMSGVAPGVEWENALKGGEFLFGRNVYFYGARSGRVETLQWLLDQGCPVTPEDDGAETANAAYKGSLEALMWLREHGFEWSNDACYEAVRSGDLEMLQWMRAQEPPCPWGRVDLLDVAQENGHLRLRRWLILQWMEDDPRREEYADVLEWLQMNNFN